MNCESNIQPYPLPQECPEESPTGSIKKGVSFGLVRIREHERILVDEPNNNVYACLAIGWAHRSSRRCMLDELEENIKNRDSTTLPSTKISRSTSLSPMATTTFSLSGTGGVPPKRFSAPERVKVLNEYGFLYQDVMRNERLKKTKNCNVTETKRGFCRISRAGGNGSATKKPPRFGGGGAKIINLLSGRGF